MSKYLTDEFKEKLSKTKFEEDVHDFVSRMAVSRYIAGGKRNITRDRLPNKYKFKYLLLLYFVQKWKSIIDKL